MPRFDASHMGFIQFQDATLALLGQIFLMEEIKIKSQRIFKKIFHRYLLGISSKSQTDWIQIKLDVFFFVPDPGVKKICSTQLSMYFILLINVKMPAILTSICRINTTCEGFKARNIVIFHHLTFYEHLKFHAKLS